MDVKRLDLFETYNVVRQIEDLKQKIKDLDLKYKPPYSTIGFNFLYYFWYIIVIGPIGMFLYLLIKQFINWKHTLFHGFLSSFFAFIDVPLKSLLIAGALFIALSVLYLFTKFVLFIVNKICDSSMKTKAISEECLAKKKAEENLLENQKYSLESQLKFSDIPFAYRNIAALTWMVNAYNNKRANNYADLINLYEQYLQNKCQNIIIYKMQQENYLLKERMHNLNGKK